MCVLTSDAVLAALYATLGHLAGRQMGSGRWSEEVDLATLHSELTLCSRGTWIRATERMPQGPDLGTVKVRLRCMDSVRHAAGVQH